MIRKIRGTVLSISEDGAVFDVGGFGIFASMPSTEKLTMGAEATVATHLAVRQDGLELYAFLDEKDLQFFEKCLHVPGVGPKTALSVLRRAPRGALESAIGKRDIAYLTRVVGLGKKAAEKMVVELKDKMGGEEVHDDDAEVFDTLIALGYTEREARRALTSIPGNISGKDARLKAALSGNAH